MALYLNTPPTNDNILALPTYIKSNALLMSKLQTEQSLQQPSSTNMTTFNKEVILVHAFSPDSIAELFLKKDLIEKIDLHNPTQTCINAITEFDFLLTQDGTIGNHLNLQAQQYHESFIDRPHISWSWGQLCHPNGRGNWENAPIAILEPLAEVGNVIGCSPDDTLSLGSHRLSEKSILLVPEAYVTKISTKLIANGSFRGQIQGYAPELTLRQAIAQQISSSYPDSLKLTNSKSDDIATLNLTPENAADHDYFFQHGYFSFVYTQDADGDRTNFMSTLFKEADDPDFAEYANRRHLGTHDEFYTDIEHGHAALKALVVLSSNLSTKAKYQYRLLSSPDWHDAKQLFLFQAYQQYLNLVRYQYGTSYGLYLLKKAIIVELYEPTLMDTSILQTDKFQQTVEHTVEQLITILAGVDDLTLVDEDDEISLQPANFPLSRCQAILQQSKANLSQSKASEKEVDAQQREPAKEIDLKIVRAVLTQAINTVATSTPSQVAYWLSLSFFSGQSKQQKLYQLLDDERSLADPLKLKQILTALNQHRLLSFGKATTNSYDKLLKLVAELEPSSSKQYLETQLIF